MIKSYRNYTPFIYRLIIYGILPFSILSGEIAMMIYRPFLPNTHEEIVDMFVRFISMCPIAMVYTIVVVDITVFKGIYSKENRYESFLLMSENGKKIIEQTVLADAICKNLLMLFVGGLTAIISYYGFPPMYKETSFSFANILSLVINSILLIQFSTWVVRHFMNWAHMLWMMAFLYTALIPMFLGISISSWITYKNVFYQGIFALVFSIINVRSIKKNIRKNWAKD